MPELQGLECVSTELSVLLNRIEIIRLYAQSLSDIVASMDESQIENLFQHVIGKTNEMMGMLEGELKAVVLAAKVCEKNGRCLM